MNRYRILHIIGARPHFMKLAPISRAIRQSELFDEIVVHTGQHYTEELSEAFIREFSLEEPAYRLGIGSGTHCKQIGQVILGLDEVLKHEHPDIVFVYGDTNSTAAGAIAAAKSGIPVAHIEAGLREGNKAIPEEINKLLTDAVSDIFFCPTQTGVDNLALSGVTDNVFLVGDTVIDLIIQNGTLISGAAAEVMTEAGLKAGRYYFLTCHRAANTNNTGHLREILSAVTQLELPVIFPIHPRTRMAIEKRKLSAMLKNSNVVLIDPQGFWRTQALIKHARATITDSGGVIKESYFHKVPCIIIDRQTEWVESVNEGWATVAGPDATAIIQAANTPIQPSAHAHVPGDGTATELILKHTYEFLKRRQIDVA